MPGLDDLAFQLAAVKGRLEDAAEGGLSRRLVAAIGDAVEPLRDEIRDQLPQHMPNRYAEVVARELDVFRRTYTSEGESRVTVYARTNGDGKRRMGRLNSGVLWHPLFGRYPRLDPRNRWFEMEPPHVTAGWFSDPCDKAAPQVREEIEKALGEIIEEITK